MYKSNFNQMQVFVERGKPEYPRKNLSEQRREPTNPTHNGKSLEIEPHATLVGGSCSHHYITTALQLVLLSTSTSVSVLTALCFKKVCFYVVRNFTFMIQPEKKFLQI